MMIICMLYCNLYITHMDLCADILFAHSLQIYNRARLAHMIVYIYRLPKISSTSQAPDQYLT